MDKFNLHILGCGSASPTTKHYPSSQVIDCRNKLFMVDCGEGTQMQFRRAKLNFNRLNHIFISHLHGDHCFGLLGFISTLGLLGRTAELVIHAQPDAEKIFKPLLAYFCEWLPFSLTFHSFDPQKQSLLYEDKSLSIHSIPLKHRIPTSGFLFSEKERKPHILPDKIAYYRVPTHLINGIKDGKDFLSEDGILIPNQELTRPAVAAKKYAYCSDTAYYEKIVDSIYGVDLLYHEATFLEADLARAKATFHSTAKQAATIAQLAQVKKLVIGHYSARYPNEEAALNEAKAIFANTVAATDLQQIPI